MNSEPHSKATTPTASEPLAVLARGLAHDVNNLMSVVLGNASLARNRLGNDHDCTPLLLAIEEAAQRAGSLTREIMSLARSDERPSEPVNLNSVVYHVLAEEETRLAPHVRIERHIDPDLWRITGNQRLVTEIVIALAFNALDAIGREGLITIRTMNVRIEENGVPSGSSLKPGKYVRLDIEDTGRGIPAAQLPRVFDPEFTTKSVKHSIGLSGVRQLLAKMNGWITLSSAEGKGTAVQVFLAVQDAPARKTFLRNLALPNGTETVLIVDDEAQIIDVGREILQRLGYTVLSARNGREAVDVCNSYHGSIDVILLDIVMPVMGGVEAYPLLKRARPAAKFIICTGFEQEDISHVLRDAGTSCLLKPFLPSALAQEIRKALDGAPVA